MEAVLCVQGGRARGSLMYRGACQRAPSGGAGSCTVVSHQAPHQPALWCQLGLGILCEEAKVGFVFDCCVSGQDLGITQKKFFTGGLSVWGRSPVGQRPVSLRGMSVIPLFSLGNQQPGM